jgi:hypothetical protein
MSDYKVDVEVRQHEAASSSDTHPILAFLGSAGGTALLTVLLGGVVAQMISCDSQRRSQQREFNNGWLKARGDQALTARKEFVDGRRNSLDEILRTIGEMDAASEELVDITQPAFAMSGYKRDAKVDIKAVVAEQTRVTTRFSKAESAWAPAQQRFAFQIAYYGLGNANVLKDWGSLQDSVNQLRKCASGIYILWHMAGRGLATYKYDPNYCKDQQSRVDANAAALGRSFGVLTDKPWSGWDNPKNLKQQLGIAD